MRSVLILAIFILVNLPNFLWAKPANVKMEIDTNRQQSEVYFFTNRPYKNKKKGIKFKNKWKSYSYKLTFASFDPNTDQYAILHNFQYFKEDKKELSAKFLAQKKDLTQFFNSSLNKEGFEKLVIVIPGYSKTFKGQIRQFIPRLQQFYGDSLNTSAKFVTFAWGNEWRFSRYFAGKRSAKRASWDYSIFHILLQEWLKEHPNQAKSIDLICLSMGNKVLENFVKFAQKYKYELDPIYDNLFLIGSDLAWNSFEKDKKLKNIEKVAKHTGVFVNNKDLPLLFSSVLNMKKRLGRKGPKNKNMLPNSVKAYNITRLMSKKDGKGLYHDYFFTNNLVWEYMLRAFSK